MAVTRLPRLKIVTALLGAMILVSMVPLVALHFNLIRINREALELAEKKFLKGSSVTLADFTETRILNAQASIRDIVDSLRLSSSIPGSDPFFSLLKSGLLKDYVEGESALLVLRAQDREGNGAKAEALRPDGTPIPVDMLLDQKLKQGYNVAMRGESWMSEPIWPEGRPEGGVVVASPVKSAGNETIGAVVAFLGFGTIITRFEEEAKAGVLAYVVDRGGSLVLSSDPTAFPSKDVHKVELVSEFISHPVRLTKVYPRSDGKGTRRVLGTLATVPSMDWGVIVEKDEASAYASVSQMTQASTLFAGLALVLAAAVAFVASRALSKPVLELVEKVQSIAEGNFKQRVKVRGVRELAELAQTFNSMSDSIEKSVEKLKLAARENQELFINSVRTLAAAIDAKDPYTRGHSERVARYSVVLARHMSLAPEEVRIVRLSALLHDVGKIGIDDRILRKPTALTSEEFEVMKTHPAKGALIMGQIPQLKEVIPGIKHHHEKWLGGGYPDGLAGEDIPRFARIVAVADTFDAMTTTRPYQKAMPLPYVINQIKSFSGKSYDPTVIVALEKAFATGDLEFLGEEVPLKASA
jgi:HD-GYP domain-containing protein (c-di-GMP phosphodiesterase class II)